MAFKQRNRKARGVCPCGSSNSLGELRYAEYQHIYLPRYRYLGCVDRNANRAAVPARLQSKAYFSCYCIVAKACKRYFSYHAITFLDCGSEQGPTKSFYRFISQGSLEVQRAKMYSKKQQNCDGRSPQPALSGFVPNLESRHSVLLEIFDFDNAARSKYIVASQCGMVNDFSISATWRLSDPRCILRVGQL
jgi:hypothetical protein